MRIQAPSFDNQRFGSSTSGDAVATWDEDSGELTVFVVNRDPATQLALDADLAAFGGLELVEATTLHHQDPYAANSADAPDTVAPAENTSVGLDGGRLSGSLPAISWSMIRLARAGA